MSDAWSLPTDPAHAGARARPTVFNLEIGRDHAFITGFHGLYAHNASTSGSQPNFNAMVVPHAKVLAHIEALGPEAMDMSDAMRDYLKREYGKGPSDIYKELTSNRFTENGYVLNVRRSGDDAVIEPVFRLKGPARGAARYLILNVTDSRFSLEWYGDELPFPRTWQDSFSVDFGRIRALAEKGQIAFAKSAGQSLKELGLTEEDAKGLLATLSPEMALNHPQYLQNAWHWRFKVPSNNPDGFYVRMEIVGDMLLVESFREELPYQDKTPEALEVAEKLRKGEFVIPRQVRNRLEESVLESISELLQAENVKPLVAGPSSQGNSSFIVITPRIEGFNYGVIVIKNPNGHIVVADIQRRTP